MKLTKEQIAELEARGIKPGVKLRCALNRKDRFIYLNWDDLYINDINSIWFRVGKRAYCIYSNGFKFYATPIES